MADTIIYFQNGPYNIFVLSALWISSMPRSLFTTWHRGHCGEEKIDPWSHWEGSLKILTECLDNCMSRPYD